MPGICGIISTSGDGELSSALSAMLAALRHHSWYVENQHVDAARGIALGRMTLGFVNQSEQPVWNQERTRLAVMDGELYQPDRLRNQLRKLGCQFDTESHAEVLLAGYAKLGESFLRDLHGSFVAAIWDHPTRQLTLVNDRFGMRPLYITQLPGKLLFASSIRALTTDSDVSRAPNWRGLAQFFTFGQYLNRDTSLEAVEVLPAAAVLQYDADKEQRSHRPYWQLSEAAAVPEREPAEWLEQIDAAFAAAVERRTVDTEQLGLSLSGGLDARTILGVIDCRKTQLQTVCLGVAGSQDHRSAREMAELAGCQHHSYILDTKFLGNFRQHLEGMVDLTDGQYLSQCIVMPTLPVYRQFGIEVLLRGHAGELMHMQKAYAFSLDQEALAIRDQASLEAWLFRHLQAFMLDGVEGPLFAAKQTDTAALARESMQQCLAQSAGIDPPLQRIWHLFVNQRLRRETTLSLAKIGSVAETRLPYLDNDLVPLLLAAPPSMKLNERIQAHILRKHRPEFLNVVNVNTGTRIEASRAWQRAASFRNRVFAKLGVPGYQPYERLGLWLRRELAPTVRDILLGEQCLERGIFNPDTVRAVVDRHLGDRHNHTFLLMALMICELGQRRLEQSAPAAAGTGGTARNL